MTYRALKLQFQLDDEALEALRDELIEAQHLAADEAGKVLVWTGDAGSSPAPAPAEPVRAPHAYTPPHLAEKILTSRSALAGERKQVTVLFADLKGSMELLADRDPEEARQLLDPVLERLPENTKENRANGLVGQVVRMLDRRGLYETVPEDDDPGAWDGYYAEDEDAVWDTVARAAQPITEGWRAAQAGRTSGS